MTTTLAKIKLRDFTTMGIGGEAECFFLRSLEQLESLEALITHHPFFILGGGSNTLVADHPLQSLCVKVELQSITWAIENSLVKASVAAGVVFDDLLKEAASRGLAAPQLLAGIPGSVGAAPVQNIGAYGAEISTFVESVDVLDLQSFSRITIDAASCAFGYRASIFNSSARGRYLILAVNFSFDQSTPLMIEHKEISQQFAGEVAYSDDASKLRDAVLAVRHAKGMLAGDGYPKSAGSFFKNPIVDVALCRRLQGLYPDMPVYPAGDSFKLAAAWLIGKTKFVKGHQYLGVGVSPFHNLSLINLGSGTYGQLMELAQDIIHAVDLQFSVKLQLEPERIEL